MDTQSDPHQFTHDAWEANAEAWDSRMGDEGNDFFKETFEEVFQPFSKVRQPLSQGAQIHRVKLLHDPYLSLPFLAWARFNGSKSGKAKF